jgi:hypothetical protein
VTRLNWKLGTVHLEIVLLLMHDWCTVCVEHSVGSEIVLEAPDGTPRLRGSCGILFRSVLKQCLRRGKIGARFAPNVPLVHKLF